MHKDPSIKPPASSAVVSSHTHLQAARLGLILALSLSRKMRSLRAWFETVCTFILVSKPRGLDCNFMWTSLLLGYPDFNIRLCFWLPCPGFSLFPLHCLRARRLDLPSSSCSRCNRIRRENFAFTGKLLLSMELPL